MESDRDLFQVVFRIVYSLWYGFSKSGKKNKYTYDYASVVFRTNMGLFIYSYLYDIDSPNDHFLGSKKKTIITLNYFLLLLLLPRLGRDIFFNKGKNEINDPL